MQLPWIIWRQTFLELWRLLLLTGVVLAVVISFAVSVRLTAQGKLGPLDTIKYMFLVMPPMMQFTLPFAAAFGATLAYHRMSQDNELAAAAASGVSHKLLLMPALVSGLVLAFLTSLLLDEIAPRSFRKIESMMKEDVARMVTGPIEAGQPLELGGTLVHADSVRRLGPNPEHGAFESLLLTGVFVVDIDETGRIRREASAGHAVVEFTQRNRAKEEGDSGSGGPATQLAMRLVNPIVFDPEQGVQPSLQSVTLYRTLPSTFDDNPKFRTTRELRQLPEHPDRLMFIDVLRRNLAYHMAERDATRTLDAALRSIGVATLTHESGRTFTIHAEGIRRVKERWELIAPRGGSINVDLSSAAGSEEPEVLLTARTGGLRSSIGKDRDTRELTMKLELERVAGRMRAGDPAGELAAKSYPHLAPTDSPLPALLKMSSTELLTEYELRAAARTADASVSAPAEELRQVLAEVGREILSKYHERWASCLSALLMVLAGALTAMRLGGSLPLTVYLWCFFPALLSVVTIATGQQVAHKVNLFGLGVLWAGVAVLLMYTLVAFSIVRRR